MVWPFSLPAFLPPETMGMGVLPPEETDLLDTEQARRQSRLGPAEREQSEAFRSVV